MSHPFRTAKELLLPGHLASSEWPEAPQEAALPHLVTPTHSAPSSPATDYAVVHSTPTTLSPHSPLPATSWLIQLPTELLFCISAFCSIKEVFLVSATNLTLQESLIVPYISGLKRFVLSDQEPLSSLYGLLQHNGSLDTIILDSKSEHPSKGPNEMYAKCFSVLRAEHLTTLIMKGCVEASASAMAALADKLTHLTALDLSFMPHLQDSVLRKLLSGNPSLAYLCMEKSYEAVTPHSLSQLPSCRGLRTISLSYCSGVNDACLLYICCLRGLRELSLAHCYEISSAALCALCKACRELAILSLEWCFNIDDSVLDAMAMYCKNMQILGIEHCAHISDTSLAMAIRAWSKLRFLSCDGCSLISSFALSAMSSRTILRDLFLNTCTRIDDACMGGLLNHTTCLQSLGVEECGISDVSVLLIAQHCPCLKVLGLNGNSKISDKSMVVLIKTLPHITRLYVSNTAITGSTVQAIAQCCAGMLSLSLVGCTVDFPSIMALGDPAYRSTYTLLDLHLSSGQHSAYHYQVNAVEGDEGTPVDLRQIIFVDRLPGQKVPCKIYFR